LKQDSRALEHKYKVLKNKDDLLENDIQVNAYIHNYLTGNVEGGTGGGG
jgi:hypothetical protein